MQLEQDQINIIANILLNRGNCLRKRPDLEKLIVIVVVTRLGLVLMTLHLLDM